MVADTLAEIEADNFLKDSGGDVEAEGLVDTLCDTLSEIVSKTIANTLLSVEA